MYTLTAATDASQNLFQQLIDVGRFLDTTEVFAIQTQMRGAFKHP